MIIDAISGVGGGSGGTIIVQKPTVTVGTYTYNGSAQGPTITWATGMADNCVVTNATKINAGTYTLTIALKNTSKMVWSDMSTADLIYTYTIDKANQTITLSSNSVTLNSANPTATVTVSGAQSTISATSSDTSIATATANGSAVTITGVASGNATITISVAGTINYNATTATCTVSCNFPKIVSWANGTDAEIAAMVEAADEGIIDLSEYWSVGDERVVTLSAMQASGTASNGVSYSVGETHVSQTVTLVLMNRGGKTLSGGGTCNFVFGLKNMLANNGSREGGYMNSTNTNAGGWNSCARRNWCNGAFYDAFPSTLRPILKQFINHTATGDSTAATDSTDWFALASEVEIFGTTTYANATAETGNTQFEYYTTSANRIKKQGDAGSANGWWERSPYSGSSTAFCFVSNNGDAAAGGASGANGLAPFGCL